MRALKCGSSHHLLTGCGVFTSGHATDMETVMPAAAPDADNRAEGTKAHALSTTGCHAVLGCDCCSQHLLPDTARTDVHLRPCLPEKLQLKAWRHSEDADLNLLPAAAS